MNPVLRGPYKEPGSYFPAFADSETLQRKEGNYGQLDDSGHWVDTGDRQKAGRAAIGSSGIPSLTQRLNRMGTFTYAPYTQTLTCKGNDGQEEEWSQKLGNGASEGGSPERALVA